MMGPLIASFYGKNLDRAPIFGQCFLFCPSAASIKASRNGKIAATRVALQSIGRAIANF